MSAPSLTYDWTTCVDSPNATSSPGSECGATPCALPDGPMTDLFGREVVLAPVSARREKAEGLTTLVTSGLIGRDSPASASLQRSLESRLMTRLDTDGSTLFKLTWKGRTTPLGRRYLERAASARRTSGSGCTSWQTPHASDNHSGMANRVGSFKGKHAQRNCDLVMLCAGWNTPISNDSEKRGVPVVGADLAGSAHLASWPTPTGEDSQCAGGPRHSATVHSAANMTGWATPKAQRADQDSHFARGNPTIGAQATLTVSGETRIGYSARDGIVMIGNGAQLNPAHSRWLMGLPRVFCDCAVTAMQSARRSPRSSSKRAKKH